MSLINKIKNALMSVMGARAQTVIDTKTNLRRHVYTMYPWLCEVSKRKDVEEAIERMDHEDEIVSTALDAIADCATTFADVSEDREFYIECEDSKAMECLDAMATETRLYYRSWDIVRTMVEKGNHFCQNVIGNGENGMGVVAVKQFPHSYQIVKNVDSGGDLLMGDPVEAMRNKTMGVAPYDQIIDYTLVACFYEFQITHFMYGVTKGGVYAKPILQSAIRNWTRLQAAEDSVAIARITRAYDHLVHNVPIPIDATPAEKMEYLRQYKEMMTRVDVADWDSSHSYTAFESTLNPKTVATEYILPRLFTPQGDIIDGSVTSVGGENPHITNLDDLDRSLNRILCALKVPAKYLNYDIGQRHFVDTGDKERDEQYGRVLRRVQKAYKNGLYSIFDLHLILNGFNPNEVEYSIIMPPIAIRAEEREANIENQRAQTATYWRSVMVPNEIIWRRVLRLSPEDIAMAQELQGVTSSEEDSQGNTVGQE